METRACSLWTWIVLIATYFILWRPCRAPGLRTAISTRTLMAARVSTDDLFQASRLGPRARISAVGKNGEMVSLRG